jgi:hypothetical protein
MSNAEHILVWTEANIAYRIRTTMHEIWLSCVTQMSIVEYLKSGKHVNVSSFH